MLCEKVIGTLEEERFMGKEVDYVDIEWYEAFKKLHKKTSRNGTPIGIRLGNEVLLKGLQQDEILHEDANMVVAVNILPCEAIVIQIEEHHEHMGAKVCYEIGNKHAALYWGKQGKTFVTPYNEPTLVLLQKLHGVTATTEKIQLNELVNISSSINAHTH